jgi:hypothetical protein
MKLQSCSTGWDFDEQVFGKRPIVEATLELLTESTLPFRFTFFELGRTCAVPDVAGLNVKRLNGASHRWYTMALKLLA